MISGSVVSVNDHQMVVNTDQGEQVTLEVDWRTMAPRDLAPDYGRPHRVPSLLEDCHFYAQRITADPDGMPTDRLQAYANTRDSEAAIARNASASGNNARNYGRNDSRPYGWSYNSYVSQYSASPAGPSPRQDASYPGRIVSATPRLGGLPLLDSSDDLGTGGLGERPPAGREYLPGPAGSAWSWTRAPSCRARCARDPGSRRVSQG
jgi:hypothetical protein